MITGSDQAASRLVIDQETLDHLPGIYKAIAEVMIEKGRWQLAEDENGNENKESRKAPAKACLSDIQRTTYDSSCIDVEV